MGTPAINLMRAGVEGEKLRLPIGDVALDERLREALEKTERARSVIVGLRPEHIFDAALLDGSRDRGVTFQAHVDVLEAMGAEYYAYSALENGGPAGDLAPAESERDGGAEGDAVPRRRRRQLIARLSIDSAVCEHETIELWFDPRRLHVFDGETGKRLTKPLR
jgi:multiple sugar transport system ATP-binding protein